MPVFLRLLKSEDWYSLRAGEFGLDNLGSGAIETSFLPQFPPCKSSTDPRDLYRSTTIDAHDRFGRMSRFNG